ncbi:MAG: hypothetical protein ABI181_09360 [Mycobacteriaceae bacterium]
MAHAQELGPLLEDVRLHHFTGGSPDTVPQLRARYEKQVGGRSPDGAQVWWSWVVRARTDGQAIGYVQATGEVTDEIVDGEVRWERTFAHARPALNPEQRSTRR